MMPDQELFYEADDESGLYRIRIFNNTQPNTICHTCSSNTPLPGKLMCLPCTIDFTPACEIDNLPEEIILRAKDVARYHRWIMEQAHKERKKE